MSTLATTNLKNPDSTINNIVLNTDGSTTVSGAITINNAVTFNGAATFSGATNSLRSGAAVVASGTAIDYTSLPSWVKRLTIVFAGVSTNGTNDVLVQVGTLASGVVSTGYTSTGFTVSTPSTFNVSTSTAAFCINTGNAADVSSGSLTIVNISGNAWVSNHTLKRSATSAMFGGGDVTLPGTLDRVRVTPDAGDAFDAGAINIIYEG